MKVSELNLKDMLEFIPDEGILKLGSQRMVIMPADSIGKLVEFIMNISDKNMVHMFMFDMGLEAGMNDAKVLKADFSPETDMDWIALGPTIQSWEGIVKAAPDFLEFDRDAKTFEMKGTWENSF